MKVYSYSGKGNREKNEDYIKSELLANDVSLHIVADGMGGYQFGEIASRVATEAIFQFITENGIGGDIHLLIQQAVEYANEQISSKRNQYHAKLGATLAGILIIDSIAYAFWLGDVQIQHFRGNKQLFISESHSLINEMKKNDVVTGKDIERYKDIVTKSLSGKLLNENIIVVQLQLLPEDTLCVCSDGFYNSIEVPKVISRQNFEVDEELKKLEHSNEDNFSIVKVSV